MKSPASKGSAKFAFDNFFVFRPPGICGRHIINTCNQKGTSLREVFPEKYSLKFEEFEKKLTEICELSDFDRQQVEELLHSLDKNSVVDYDEVFKLLIVKYVAQVLIGSPRVVLRNFLQNFCDLSQF